MSGRSPSAPGWRAVPAMNRPDQRCGPFHRAHVVQGTERRSAFDIASAIDSVGVS